MFSYFVNSLLKITGTKFWGYSSWSVWFPLKFVVICRSVIRSFFVQGVRRLCIDFHHNGVYASMAEDSIAIKGFEVIKQGAEARLYKGTYLGRSTLIKERFVKKYRHSDLDTLLTKERTKGEARAIVRAKIAGVRTPALFLVDFYRRRIYMEYIDDAVTLKDFIDTKISDKDNVDHLITSIADQVGSAVARLHSKNIIHGDLTTSNMLLKNHSERQNEEAKIGDIVLIDFGLAHVESTAEDKAVDLYVLERALLSAHSEFPTLFPNILKSYQEFCTSKDKRDVIIKYKEVQARGRKRLMVG